MDKPFVRIIDDSVNDNGETVKVKISNARLCNDASQTVFHHEGRGDRNDQKQRSATAGIDGAVWADSGRARGRAG